MSKSSEVLELPTMSVAKGQFSRLNDFLDLTSRIGTVMSMQAILKRNASL
jgi:hypothetical protein